jgi:ADP-heptose:LPS heptosyltransferase
MAGLRDRVLFITNGCVGDAVLTSGLLRRLVECEPEAHFTIVAGPVAAQLFSDTPRLEQLIALRRRRYKLHWLDLWRQVRGRPWKVVIDMRGSGLAYLLSAKRRRVYRPAPQRSGSPPLHKVLEAARVIGSLDRPPPPYLYTSAAREARADDLVGSERPILAIAPAAGWPPKTWPAERFAQTAVQLLDGPLAGGRALLTGGPRDSLACEFIRSALPPDRVIDLVGLDLLTTYACLKRARLFIGNDSGLMHLSASSGAPTLGLFGPTDDRAYRPWGPRTAFVRCPRELREAEARFAVGGYDASFMTDLSVAVVVRSARDLLERTRNADCDGSTVVSSQSANLRRLEIPFG